MDAQQNEEKMSLVKRIAMIFVIMAVIGILLYYVMQKGNTPEEGPHGGVTTAEDAVPTPPDTTTTTVLTAPVDTSAHVSTIEIIRNTENMTRPATDNNDWRTLNVAEVIAIDGNGARLLAQDYSSAEQSSKMANFSADNLIDGDLKTFAHTEGIANVHWMRLKLKSPARLSEVKVVARQQCCQSRMIGATLNLYSAENNLIKSMDLINSPDAQILRL